MRNDLPALAEQLRRQSALIRRAVATVDADLSGRRFVARSDDGAVEAEADHHGRLLDLRMPRTGLTRGHGSRLSGQVVQAVSRVRELAVADYQAQLRARLHSLRAG